MHELLQEIHEKYIHNTCFSTKYLKMYYSCMHRKAKFKSQYTREIHEKYLRNTLFQKIHEICMRYAWAFFTKYIQNTYKIHEICMSILPVSAFPMQAWNIAEFTLALVTARSLSLSPQALPRFYSSQWLDTWFHYWKLNRSYLDKLQRLPYRYLY